MSFQAYLDTIRQKTGKGPEDFRKLAEKGGYLRQGVRAGEIVAWLKSDFKLGHGHAMAIYGVLRSAVEPPRDESDRLSDHFEGRRAKWNDAYATIVARANTFGKDQPLTKVGDSYLSLLRKGKKFAILRVGVDFLDIGIKLKKDAPANGRLRKAGAWNRMVSHRLRLNSPDDLDEAVFIWLREAYNAVV